MVHCNFPRGGVLFERRILHAILVMCAACMSMSHYASAQQSYEVIAQDGVPMKTRDGVTLRADIYHPKGDGKFPVIMMRTPYDKSVAWAVSPAYQIASHGSIVLVQHVLAHYTPHAAFHPSTPHP